MANLDALKLSKIKQLHRSLKTFSKASVVKIDSHIAQLAIIAELIKLDSTISIPIGNGQVIDSSNVVDITTQKGSIDTTCMTIENKINNSSTIEECNLIDITREFLDAGFTF